LPADSQGLVHADILFLSTPLRFSAKLRAAIRVASTEMEEVNEAHELPERQSETGGSQERKSLGVPVERGSAGRRNPSKAHRYWNAGRLADGVSRPSRGRRDPLRDQPTTPQRLIKKIGFETLVNHYRQHELPDTFNKTKPVPDAADEDRKSYSTQVTYEGYLKKWILPRWRVCR
jgi:hypothetical protein